MPKAKGLGELLVFMRQTGDRCLQGSVAWRAKWALVRLMTVVDRVSTSSSN